jgi:bifunctional lysine-specific demethylase and histidyl-hydroxylase NO66
MQEPWLNDPLGHLIGAGRIADFLARVYEREALVVAHGDSARFDGLINIDAVDRIISGVDLREGQLDLADASRDKLARTDYIDAAGYIDRGAIADFHRGGATIILQQAHQIEPSLGRFCRGLEFVFSAHVQTNLYLTPPNAQGFKTHYDNHDVFVLQMAGEKAWRLYEKPVDTPFRGEEFQSGVHQSGEVQQEFLLKAGDCAYVPRGMMHDAMTSGDAPSLHVTVGLITRTWADLMLEAVSEAALRTPELRRSLPPGYARRDFDRTEARAHLQRLGEIVAREIKLDPAMDLSADNFIRSRAPDNRFAVRDAARPVLANDTFQAQALSPYRIAEDGDRVVIIAPGGELKFIPSARPALERALNGATFTPADLVGAQAPEDMTAKLLAYGLVKRV